LLQTVSELRKASILEHFCSKGKIQQFEGGVSDELAAGNVVVVLDDYVLAVHHHGNKTSTFSVVVWVLIVACRQWQLQELISPCEQRSFNNHPKLKPGTTKIHTSNPQQGWSTPNQCQHRPTTMTKTTSYRKSPAFSSLLCV
jgi:hypothetical protein